MPTHQEQQTKEAVSLDDESSGKNDQNKTITIRVKRKWFNQDI